ncbi:MAG: DNA mismatch repair protein MutS [Clostridia bacterium]|nr:DNA mismatch repair protein MutS [Clostridia bacterium]
MAKTPMMQQYLQVKEQYPDAILFYRLGDFYEMFFDDAKTASRELELTLTGRDCGEEERAPMCGVPYHAAETYIGRLVNRGYKVVVCEQMEDPALAKGLVKRDVVRIVTPGTVMGENLPSETKNNYLCAICVDGGAIALVFCDISTGDMNATLLSGEGCVERAINELGAYTPSEVIMNVSRYDLPDLSLYLDERLNAFVTDKMTDSFVQRNISAKVGTLFAPDTVAELENNKTLGYAVCAMLDYIADTQRTESSYIKSLNIYTEGQFLEMDISTRRNLELTETMRSKEKRGSLLGVLDRTHTSMGARLLRKWIERPLVNPFYIDRRLNAVEELTKDDILRGELGELLRGVFDLERLTGKLVYGSANARDLVAVAATLSRIPDIRRLLSAAKSDELSGIYNSLDELGDVRDLINSAIVDEPPFSVREGGFIRRGYNAEVDRLFTIVNDGSSYVRDIEERERARTGIPKLKVGYNRVFGYYIEISKSFADRAPDDYIRKQTLVNCERYITPELKELESTILGASDKLNTLEYQLFCDVCSRIIGGGNLERIQATAGYLSTLDVYLSLADVACRSNYTRPEVEYGEVIKIKEGRHPVVEAFATDGYFVPNDTLLDCGFNRMMLITGPNMAGKSTYMRQVALITLMAQLGSFVPASEARIGICDKIFTRVGASDDLSSGQSTFMLEMTEVAYILKNATRRSLIIYDEIGRGTSTYDGMSIAKAVVEYTAGKKIGAKTLFATHYHELTALEGEVEGVINYNIAAKKKGDTVTFLRRIVRGATDDSYGIEVAQIAGVPREVIKRAREALKKIESEGKTPVVKTEKPDDGSISFEDISLGQIRDKLRGTDVNLLTPLEALNLIVELQKML